MDIAELMRERPDAWGLRGDPHLWDEMERTLEAVPLPEDRSDLERLLQRCFEKHAGISLAFEGEHFVPRFDTGGMSSGQVLPAFWRAQLIPLLLDRAQHAREVYNRRVADLLTQAKQLARDYRALTGKPLGITGEVAEFAAAQALGLTLASAREAGYDAVKYVEGREIRCRSRAGASPTALSGASAWAGSKPSNRGTR